MSNQFDPRGLINSVASANAMARQALTNTQAHGQQLVEIIKNGQAMQTTLAQIAMRSTGGNPSLQYVENIPGRRIPFDLLVDIPIAAGLMSETQGTITINQDGPFIAVARVAAFVSQFQLRYRDPTTGNNSDFFGRSYGRYRPFHSAWDLNDGIPRSEITQAVAAPGAGQPHIISPSNASSFRSMQGDFRIRTVNEGFAYPRSNIEVPSPLWTKQINSPFSLGALDVFERGEVITFRVLPLHPSNPNYGDIQSFTGPGNVWPFLASQYDAIEGINDEVDALAESTDPVTRLPNAVLTIGFHGYKVIQPPGAGPY